MFKSNKSLEYCLCWADIIKKKHQCFLFVFLLFGLIKAVRRKEHGLSHHWETVDRN